MKKLLLLIVSLFALCFANAQNLAVYDVSMPSSWSNSPNTSLAAAPNGHVFILNSLGFPHEFNGVSVSIFDTVGFATGTNYDIDENYGKLFVGKSTGLFVYENNAWVKYNMQNSPMPSNKIRCVKAAGNTVYAGTDSGLVRKTLLGWEIFNTNNSGIISNDVSCVDVLDNGNVVAGTFNGLSIYNGTTWTNFTTANSIIENNNIRYIKACQNSTFWVVTSPSQDSTDLYPGYYLFKNGQFISLSMLEDNCLYRNVSQNASRAYSIDGAGNLIVTIGGNLKKYLHPDNPQVETTMLKAVIPTSLLGRHGEYSSYGFDCFLAGGVFKLIFDSCFTSQYVIDSLQIANGREVIDINNIKATVRSIGDLYTDYDNVSPNQVPKSICSKTNFAAALWLGGIDSGGNLHGAAMTYRQTGVDYWPGPMDTINGICADDASGYDKIWKINKSMILDFQQNYQNGPAYIHPDILSWPGNGTGNMATKLAPFVDLNFNGIYEPLLGDYPKLVGDEMLYWIFNDACGPHGETGCSPLGVEVHGMAYAYVCDDIDPASADYALNNTVFYRYTIYNRTLNNYSNFYISWWNDVDLGYSGDDYVGCDINRNAAFVYNGDNYDEGAYGYGLNPPMQSYVQLSGPFATPNDGQDNNHNGLIDEDYEPILFSNFMYYNNDFSISGNPETCNHIYGYMQNNWKDGSHTVYNGTNGYGSGTPYNYMFPTAPYSNGEPGDTLPPWNEQLSGNTPGDRRFIMSCGPSVLEPGQITVIEYATIFSHYSTAPNGTATSLALNNSYVDNVTNWYLSQNYPSCYDPTPVVETPVSTGKLNVYPNPATNMVTININGKTDALDFCVTDMAGKTVVCGKGNTINLDSFANGMYLLYAKNNEGIFYTKLIKQ